MKDKKEKIFNQLLKIIPFEGWTDEALRSASKAAGLEPEYAEIAFPKGAGEALEYLFAKIDDDMHKKLKKVDMQKLKIRERIIFAVKTRFECAAPYKQAIKKGISFFARPDNSVDGASGLWKTVDEIWYAVGDKSTDFNYYTKRMTLAAVYSSTLLYWLSDESPEHEETWGFLERRIENVMQFGKFKSKIEKLFSFGRKNSA